MKAKIKIYLLIIFLVPIICYSQTWQDVGGGTNNQVYALKEYNNNLYVGGWFDSVNNFYSQSIAVWNSSNWNTVGSGLYGTPYSFTVYNNELYAGGDFFYANGVPNTYHIARWNGTNWLSAGSTNNDVGQIKAMATYNNNLYAAGNITKIGGVNVNRIGKWNESNWSNVSGGVTGGFMTEVTTMTTLNNKLYIAGDFNYAGTQVAFNIASWDGVQWMDLDTGLSDRALTMTADTIHNNLYVAGAFNLVGGIHGINVNYIAGWNGNNWFSLDQGLSGGIRCMTMYHGDLYVGGSMLIVGSDSTTIYVARWDGVQWHKVIGPNSTVFALQEYKDTLYVGGAFTLPYNNIARYYTPYSNIKEELIPEPEYLGNCIPNPTNGAVVIPYFLPLESKGIISITNIEGTQIKSFKLNPGNNELNISLIGLTNGAYLCKLDIDCGKITRNKKLILNR